MSQKLPKDYVLQCVKINPTYDVGRNRTRTKIIADETGNTLQGEDKARNSGLLNALALWF